MGMECWLYKLSPKLTVKAQQTYAGMEKSELGDYNRVMATILRHNLSLSSRKKVIDKFSKWLNWNHEAQRASNETKDLVDKSD